MRNAISKPIREAAREAITSLALCASGIGLAAIVGTAVGALWYFMARQGW